MVIAIIPQPARGIDAYPCDWNKTACVCRVLVYVAAALPPKGRHRRPANPQPARGDPLSYLRDELDTLQASPEVWGGGRDDE